MSKSKRNNGNGNNGNHNGDGDALRVPKSEARHKFKVAELEDFNRRETRPDGSEKMMPRIAVLTPVDGGKQVRAYVPGNLDAPLEVGTMVMCRPHDKHNNNDGPPIKFRITNVVDAHAGAGAEMTPSQNAEFGERAPKRARVGAAEAGAGAGGSAMERPEAGVRR